jgi:hypothetical protein
MLALTAKDKSQLGRVIAFEDSKIITPTEANPSKALMLSKRKSYDV